MATVTGLTAPRMLEIEANSVVDGTVDANGHLILTTHGGDTIDAGKVKGDKGEGGGTGPAGPVSSPNPEPIAPTGLSVSSNTAYYTPAGQPVATVVFNWPVPIHDILGDVPAIDQYELWYRLPTAPNATLLATSGVNSASVTTLDPGVSYRVKVRAHSFQGEWGAFSPEINVTPVVPSDSVPQEPGNAVILTNVGGYQSDGRAQAVLHFKWDPVIDSTEYKALGIQAYEVWLINSDGAASPMLSTPETEVYLSFPSGVRVELKVRAMSNFGIWGDFSASDVVTTAFPAQNNSATTIPVLTTNMGVVYSSWDGNLVTGPAGPEFQHLITETAPAPTGPWTAIGVPAIVAGQTATIPSSPGANVSVRFRWRDKLGRLSAGISPVASITVLGIEQNDFHPDLSGIIDQLEHAVTSVITEYAVSVSDTVAPTTGWSTTTPARTPGTYIWTRTTTNYADSTSTTSSPVVITGNSGSSGTDGKGISSTAVTYQLGSSGTSAPTGAWVGSPPATSPGQFLWTRTVTTYTDTTTTTAYSVAAHGATGASGVGISSTVVTYQVGASGTVAPVGTWTTTPGATSPGQFLWTRTVTNYTDTSNSTAYSVSAHGATGATGSTGAAGKGIAATTVTYQVHTNGTTAPTGTWTTTPGATSPGQFLWTRTVIDYTDSTQVTVYGVSAHGATGATGNTGSTGAAGTDATTVQIGNDAIALPTDPSGNTVGSFVITIPFSGWIGNARAAATIAATGLPTGITAGTNTPATTGADGSLLLNVASASNLGGTSYGEITLTTICNGKTFVNKFTWSKAPQGATGATGSTGSTGGTGAAGTSATSIDIGNEAVVIPTTAAGLTTGASTITVPFTGYVGTTKTATSVVVSGLPTGITVQSNTAGTGVADGSLVLAVASGSALGGTDFGNITLTVTCNSIPFVQVLTWSKAIAGATGSTGSTGSTGAAGADATSIQVGNDAVALPTDPTGATSSSYVITIPFGGYIGNARAAASVVPTGMPTGITVGTNTAATASADGSLVLNVANASTLGGTSYGQITLTFTCNGKTFVQIFSWSKAPQGVAGAAGATGGNGAAGTSATMIDVGNEAVVIPATSAGLTTGASTITVPFTGYVGTAKTATTIAVSGLPTGITVQSNTAGTNVADGSLVLAVASGSALGGTDFGNITLTVTCNSIVFTQVLTWSKAIAGTPGATGGTGSTGAAGADATTVQVGNDAVAIPTDATGATTSTYAITIPFSGWIGNARAAATIAASGLPAGITAGTNTAATNLADGSLILNVASASTLGGGTAGQITLTLVCNGKTFTQVFSWAKTPAGAAGATGGTGSAGAAATSIDVGMSSAVIPTDATGNTTGASTITIPFTGFVGATRAAASVVVSGLPTGITVNTNTAGTSGAAGSLVLSVAGSSSLGGTSSGVITLTITCNALTFVQTFTWSKAPAGATGGTGGTGAAGADATTIQVGNDAVAIPTDATGATTTTYAILIPFSGWIGNTRAAATIAPTGLPSGITAGTNTAATSSADGSLTLNVAAASTLGGTAYGQITLTLVCNGKTFTQIFSWAKTPVGATGATGSTGSTGSAGVSATSIDVSNEAVVIPCTSAGATLASSTITIPFTGFVGTTRAAITVSVGTLPTGITVQTNTAGTSAAAGSLVLAVASGSTLGGTNSGDIVLTLTCNALVFTQIVSWSKGIAGATGSTGGTGAAGKGVSSITPYYLQQGTGVAAPAAPTTNPPGGSWVITEPGYLTSTELYRAELYVFTDATFGWTTVSKVSAYTAATQAMTAANLSTAAAQGLIKAQQTDPGQAVGRIWLVLDASGNIIGIKISNGSTWSSYVLMADQIIVPGSLGTVSIANGAVNAAKVNATSIWADDAWLNVLRAGIIESSMVTSTFGAELSLESNVAVSTIITTQSALSTTVNQTNANLAATNSQVSTLSTNVGTAKSTADDAKTAAAAAQATADSAQTKITTTQTWFRVDASGAHVGQTNNAFQTHIYPDRFAITDNGTETTSWSSQTMTVNKIDLKESIKIGKHVIELYPSPVIGPPTGTIIRSS